MIPVLLQLAVALLLAFLAGRICSRISVPRVTGYLVTGILMGPSVLARFHHNLPAVLRVFSLHPSTTAPLQVIKDLAQALILFTIGTSFRTDRLRGMGRRGMVLSATDIGLTFGLVFAAMGAATAFRDIGLVSVLAAVAVATAPAATLLVLRELESEGPTTNSVLILLAMNNVASLVLFAVFFGSIYLGGPWSSLATLGRGALVGLVCGVVLAVLLLQAPSSSRSYAIVGVSGVLATWGGAQWVEGNTLLAAMVAGAVLVNSSPNAEALSASLAGLDYPIYVLFFVLAGADLHIDYLLGLHPVGGLPASAVLLLTLSYIVGRTLGKVLSAPVATRIYRGRRRSRTDPRTGLALLAQAGLAIALADMAVRLAGSSPELGPSATVIRSVVLASVTLFELVGPLAVRYAVVRAGEVQIVNLLPDRVEEGLAESVFDTLERLRASLGLPTFPRGKGEQAPIRAVDLMRRNVEPLRAEMHLDEVMRTFASAPFDQYPVVDADERFIGVIAFPDIRTVLFDDLMDSAVLAVDLITGQGVTCGPETPLEELIHHFGRGPQEYSYLPVVDPKTKQVLGIIAQRDAIVAYRKHI